MNNQEILRKIVNYIENVMKEKSLTSRDLADICVKKTVDCQVKLTHFYV